MLAKICPIPPWIKRLVTKVQGLSDKLAGCNPRIKIRSCFIRVAINSSRFIAIKSHMAVNLKPRYAITLPTLSHIIALNG